MGASKQKKVIQKEIPSGRYVGQVEDPNSYYQKSPAWNFNTCDNEMWAFSEENAGSYFWNEILPRLKEWETQTWHDILITAKKQNHSIDVAMLNPCAQKRLTDKYIEQDSIISLRLNGTHRIYGYVCGSVFNILWFDPSHGDNDTCVCKSKKKHT